MNISKLISKFDNEVKNFVLLNLKGNDIDNLTEVRLRVGQNIQLIFNNYEKDIEGFVLTLKHINDTVVSLADFSLYAIEEDMKNGFFTVSGGHRIGVCGKVISDNQRVLKITSLSSIIIRIAREVKNVSDNISPLFSPLKSALIVSPPACGKTTMLRDLTRNISNRGYKVTVIDERSEIAGMYKGIAQNDLGRRTDILDSCPKNIGLNIALRCTSPDIVVLDEIGTDEDIEGLYRAFNSGIKVLATVHSENLTTLRKKIGFEKLLSSDEIELFIFLSKEKGEYRSKVYDKFDWEVLL